MKQSAKISGLVALLGLIVFAEPPAVATPPPAIADLTAACQGRDGWADPAPPAHIYGDTWFVGTCGITVLLITSNAGHVLIDSGPAEAAPLVIANIEKLGFDPRDVRWILSSHEHDDHVGAVAELKRLTGAKFAALDTGSAALAAGRPGKDDPQSAIAKPFAPITVDRVLRDGERLSLGKLHFTVRSTPAHSAGSTSWTWQSCVKRRCTTMTYADSATVISADEYRFADHPDRVAAARKGLDRIKTLPCGILMTPHPAASDLFQRIAGRAPLIDEQACRAYATQAEVRLATRLDSEKK